MSSDKITISLKNGASQDGSPSSTLAELQGSSGNGDDGEGHFDPASFEDDLELSPKHHDEGALIHGSNASSWTNTGSVYSVKSIGSDNSEHITTIDVSSVIHDNEDDQDNDDIVITCFCEGTWIETKNGPVKVETLSVGDEVLCGDGECRPLRWISERHISSGELNRHPNFRPVRIMRDALGDNTPTKDLLVSPQHRILLDDWRAEIMFGEIEVLVAAVHLINGDSITRDFGCGDVTYYHFMFDDHQTVIANGMKTESFFPGSRAVQGLDKEIRKELFALFPDLRDFPESYGETCAPELKAHEVMAMLGA